MGSIAEKRRGGWEAASTTWLAENEWGERARHPVALTYSLSVLTISLHFWMSVSCSVVRTEVWCGQDGKGVERCGGVRCRWYSWLEGQPERSGEFRGYAAVQEVRGRGISCLLGCCSLVKWKGGVIVRKHFFIKKLLVAGSDRNSCRFSDLV